MKLSTFILASCLIMLMACYRNKKQPEDYLYKQGTSNHIYFQKEEGKTIYCILKKGSSISFDCQDNGYTYVYSPDSNLTYSGKMPFIPAYTSYIEFYGKRFYPRKPVVVRNGTINHADNVYIGDNPRPSPFPDSTIKPTYEYVYKTTIPINQLQPTLDTLDMIMRDYGIDMMGSRISRIKQLFNEKIGILLGRIVVDSVKAGGIK